MAENRPSLKIRVRICDDGNHEPVQTTEPPPVEPPSEASPSTATTTEPTTADARKPSIDELVHAWYCTLPNGMCSHKGCENAKKFTSAMRTHRKKCKNGIDSCKICRIGGKLQQMQDRHRREIRGLQDCTKDDLLTLATLAGIPRRHHMNKEALTRHLHANPGRARTYIDLLNRDRRVDFERTVSALRDRLQRETQVRRQQQQQQQRQQQQQQEQRLESVAAATAHVAAATAQLATAFALPVQGRRVAGLPVVTFRAVGQAATGDIEATYATVALCDPIALTRIKTPVRSYFCKHAQCFDLEVYKSRRMDAGATTTTTTTPRCTMCDNIVFEHSLVFDEWFAGLLSRTPTEHKFVEYDTRTGQLMRSYSDRAAGKRKATSAPIDVDAVPGSASTAPIDLDSD